MRFALSSRPWETSGGYTITLAEQIRLAAALGYQGIELRYPLIPAPKHLIETRKLLQEHGMEIVFAPCAAVPKDEKTARDALRVLDALQGLGCRFLKMIVASTDDYIAMRKLADWAAPRGIRVCTQVHVGTLTDTVERTEKCLRELEHENIGLIFDPTHLAFLGDYNIDAAIERLYPYTDLLNIQCYALPTPTTLGRNSQIIAGREWITVLPEEYPSVDVRSYLEKMAEAGFRGWATVMPPWEPEIDGAEVARNYLEYLRDAALG